MNNEIPYVESLPAHWSVIQNRFLFKYDGEKVGGASAQYQLLSLTTAGVKERDINATGGKIPASYDNYQTVRKGQMVFCLFDLDCSAVFSGISNYDGMITSAYDVFSSTGRMDNAYADYWFKYVFSNRYYKMFSKSIRYTITGDMFRSLKTPVPPIDEQRRIASFLLEQETKVDALIANVQAQIEKLKAYKQSVITEVVTKGIEPSVPMKDSGVEWIGEIPKHWSMTRIKFICDTFGRIGFRGYTTDDFVPEGEGAITLSPSNFNDMKMNYSKCSYLSWDKYNESPEIQIKNGDVLFVKTGSTYGKSCLVYNLPCEATINPQSIVFKNFKCDARLFCYFLNSVYAYWQVEQTGVGGTIPTIAQSKIINYIIVLPDEQSQAEIVAYLDEKCSQIDRLIAIKQKKINKLTEYKKSLIYEYVTGKKEVS